MDFLNKTDRPQEFLSSLRLGVPQLAILIDPDKFDRTTTKGFLQCIPQQTTHLFVGGSEVAEGATEAVIKEIKAHSDLPVMLFPGHYSQLSELADGLLFLSLYSGDNPEYLIGQQRKAVSFLRNSALEIIPTAYLLIDGGNTSAVARVTATRPLDQNNADAIVEVALAAQYCGAKCIYLEAGSGANYPVAPEIISAVKEAVNLPLIVGGGIRSDEQLKSAYSAGANMVVMGTAFEK